MNVYYAGFAIQIDAYLKVQGKALTDAQLAGLTVTAYLVKADRSGLAAGTAAATCTKPGGDTVRAAWTAGQTAGVVPGRYLVEFHTSDGPYCHEGVPIEIRAGVAP